MTGFENKTGNIISLIFFSVIVFCLFIIIIFSPDISGALIFFLLFISISGLAAIVISDFFPVKENKIIPISYFLISNIFLLSSLMSVIISGKFKLIKTSLTFILIVFTGLFTVFIYVLNFKDSSGEYSSGNKKADAGVILGAAVWGGNRPSPVLKERINKGYEIYQKRIVPKLVITGGGSPNELTEGEVSKNVLLKYGVAPENLILENFSSSTVEQIQFVRDSLYKIKNWNKIILISDHFHLMRASEISKFNDMNADCIASDKELSAEGTISFCLKESLALIIFWMSGV